MYGILVRLEDWGWLENRLDYVADRTTPPRRYYRLTSDGAERARAAVEQAEHRAIRGRRQRRLSPFGKKAGYSTWPHPPCDSSTGHAHTDPTYWTPSVVPWSSPNRHTETNNAAAVTNTSPTPSRSRSSSPNRTRQQKPWSPRYCTTFPPPNPHNRPASCARSSATSSPTSSSTTPASTD